MTQGAVLTFSLTCPRTLLISQGMYFKRGQYTGDMPFSNRPLPLAYKEFLLRKEPAEMTLWTHELNLHGNDLSQLDGFKTAKDISECILSIPIVAIIEKLSSVA